jgi:hypothetical protein
VNLKWTLHTAARCFWLCHGLANFSLAINNKSRASQSRWRLLTWLLAWRHGDRCVAHCKMVSTPHTIEILKYSVTSLPNMFIHWFRIIVFLPFRSALVFEFFTPWISIYCRCHILFLCDGMRVFGPNISDLRLGTSEVPVRRSPSHWCWEVEFDKPMFPGWKEAVSSPLLLVYINWAAQLNLEANHLCTHTVHFPWLS